MEIAYTGSLPQSTTTAVLPPPAPAPAATPPAAAAVTRPASHGLPEFERAQVARSSIKVSGQCAVDAFDETICLDDRIRVVGEFRVVRVNHVVDKDGAVVREQIISPCGELQLAPWNSADPSDVGIVRARG